MVFCLNECGYGSGGNGQESFGEQSRMELEGMIWELLRGDLLPKEPMFTQQTLWKMKAGEENTEINISKNKYLI
jgi:hypothetical protein